MTLYNHVSMTDKDRLRLFWYLLAPSTSCSCFVGDVKRKPCQMLVQSLDNLLTCMLDMVSTLIIPNQALLSALRYEQCRQLNRL